MAKSYKVGIRRGGNPVPGGGGRRSITASRASAYPRASGARGRQPSFGAKDRVPGNSMVGVTRRPVRGQGV
jgi:hypothetical protein